jgi:hypothetical protein
MTPFLSYILPSIFFNIDCFSWALMHAKAHHDHDSPHVSDRSRNKRNSVGKSRYWNWNSQDKKLQTLLQKVRRSGSSSRSRFVSAAMLAVSSVSRWWKKERSGRLQQSTNSLKR